MSLAHIFSCKIWFPAFFWALKTKTFISVQIWPMPAFLSKKPKLPLFCIILPLFLLSSTGALWTFVHTVVPISFHKMTRCKLFFCQTCKAWNGPYHHALILDRATGPSFALNLIFSVDLPRRITCSYNLWWRRMKHESFSISNDLRKGSDRVSIGCRFLQVHFCVAYLSVCGPKTGAFWTFSFIASDRCFYLVSMCWIR